MFRSAFLITLLLSYLFANAQDTDNIDIKELMNSAAPTYFKPVCDPAVNKLELALGLESGAFTDKLDRKAKKYPESCLNTGFTYRIYDEKEIEIEVVNVRNCMYLLYSVQIRGFWSKVNENSLLVKALKAYPQIPAVAQYPDKKTTRFVKKMDFTAPDGNTYKMDLLYEPFYGEGAVEFEKLMGTAPPKKHAGLVKIFFRMSYDDKLAAKEMTDEELGNCGDSSLKVSSEEEIADKKKQEQFEAYFKSFSKEKLEQMQLPTTLEGFTALTDLWKSKDADRLVMYSDKLAIGYHKVINKREYVKSVSGIKMGQKNNILFEGNYLHGYPTDPGFLFSFSRGFGLKGMFVLGMPHGLMQEFRSETDSTAVMYHLGVKLTEQTTITHNGIKVKAYTLNGEPLLTGLITEVYPDGRQVDAEYVNGQRTKAFVIHYPDGSYYEGELNASLQPDGFGRFYFDPEKHLGTASVKGNFSNGKPIAGETYIIRYKRYWMETTIDDQLLPHSPEGYKTKGWLLKREDFSHTNVNFVHGKPTTARLYGTAGIDVQGYPTGMRRDKYEGEVDANIKPHGQGELYVDEGRVSADNKWTGTFEHGKMVSGTWRTKPFEKRDAIEKHEDNMYQAIVDSFIAIHGFAGYKMERMTAYSGAGQTAYISISDRGYGVSYLVIDEYNASETATATVVDYSLSAEGKRLKITNNTQPQTLKLTYSHHNSLGNKMGNKYYMTRYNAGSFEYYSSVSLEIKASTIYSNLHVYVIH